ncbi:DUF2269 family protein [Endothiovibrio diazotrophicus]
MEYLIVKWLHVLSSTLLFGTGLGSAFYKYFADRRGEPVTVAQVNRLVVWADWIFTTPTVIVQPLSGLLLVHLAGFPLSSPWLVVSIVLYLIAGACWLPVVWLQIRMQRLAEEAVRRGTGLPAEYRRLARIWFWLGVPAFLAMVGVFFLMVVKPSFG